MGRYCSTGLDETHFYLKCYLLLVCSYVVFRCENVCERMFSFQFLSLQIKFGRIENVCFFLPPPFLKKFNPEYQLILEACKTCPLTSVTHHMIMFLPLFAQLELQRLVCLLQNCSPSLAYKRHHPSGFPSTVSSLNNHCFVKEMMSLFPFLCQSGEEISVSQK